ncbi:hypothetical protein DFJ73DRAFT_623836, partial [Zopfochytrium polystomum]
MTLPYHFFSPCAPDHRRINPIIEVTDPHNEAVPPSSSSTSSSSSNVAAASPSTLLPGGGGGGHRLAFQASPGTSSGRDDDAARSGRRVAVDVSGRFGLATTNLDPRHRTPIPPGRPTTFIALLAYPFHLLLHQLLVLHHRHRLSHHRRHPPASPPPFPDNSVRTTRYTAADFLPRQLAAQFSKFGNFYFLVVAVLQLVPGLSPTGQVTTLVPLAVFVGVAMGKEGWEDWGRWRNDRRENEAAVEVLGNGRCAGDGPAAAAADAAATERGEGVGGEGAVWIQVQRKAVKVGDILRVRKGEILPADLVFLGGPGCQKECFIETSNLDGETTYKQKTALDATGERVHRDADLLGLAVDLWVESPNGNIHTFSGTAASPLSPLSSSSSTAPAPPPTPLSAKHFLPRGATLQNPEVVYGVAVYTGEDTKIRRNFAGGGDGHGGAGGGGGVRGSKRPQLERCANFHVGAAFLLVFALAVGSTLQQMAQDLNQPPDVWQPGGGSRGGPQTAGRWYLSGVGRPTVAEAFFGYLILYNTIVPIALYVAMEIVKVLLAWFIESDPAMFCDEDDCEGGGEGGGGGGGGGRKGGERAGAKARTSQLPEDLGQVQYLFTDKTGTLTENRMVFRKMSVNGALFVHGGGPSVSAAAAGSAAAAAWEDDNDDGDGRGESSMSQLPTAGSVGRKSTTSTAAGGAATTAVTAAAARSTEDLASGKLGLDTTSRTLLLAMALCHTVSIEADSSSTSSSTTMATAAPPPKIPRYQSSSPDEIALARAAAELGFVYTGRGDGSVLQAVVRGERTEATQLHVFEFTSERKRMSVVLRMGDGRVRVFTKGADSVILERVQVVGAGGADQQQGLEALEPTLQHLTEFASEGLRTLLYATREVSEAEYVEWRARYDAARLELVRSAGGGGGGGGRDDLAERMEAVVGALERDLTLLGATGVEDRLQARVPETIAQLQRAGIKIWMLTGDKLETAVNIATNSGLAKDHSEVILISGRDARESSTAAAAGQSTTARPAASNATASGVAAHCLLVIDGNTLAVLEDDHRRHRFLLLGLSCESVVCSRFSPLQKARVVSKVREIAPMQAWLGSTAAWRSASHGALRRAYLVHAFRRTLHLPNVASGVTLAIGDGANDIPMLESAHVGVGIAGREGLAASRAADYSLQQFRHLEPLLLVHGHYAYHRLCQFIDGTFYKCVVFYLTQAVFQGWTGWTGTSMYEQWTLSLYNVLFTSVGVIVLGTVEMHLHRGTLIAVPELYRYGTHQLTGNLATVPRWIVLGAWHSLV